MPERLPGNLASGDIHVLLFHEVCVMVFTADQYFDRLCPGLPLMQLMVYK